MTDSLEFCGVEYYLEDIVVFLSIVSRSLEIKKLVFLEFSSL